MSVHKLDYPTTSRKPGHTHRQRVLSNLKNLLTKRISMKTFSRKPKKLNLDNMAKAPSKDNVYVGVKFSRTEDSKYLKKSLRKTEELPHIRFKMDTSQCARCILGDSALTCTCSFRQRAPDFKLYEDYDQFLFNFPSSLGTYVQRQLRYFALLCIFSTFEIKNVPKYDIVVCHKYGLSPQEMKEWNRIRCRKCKKVFPLPPASPLSTE